MGRRQAARSEVQNYVDELPHDMLPTSAVTVTRQPLGRNSKGLLLTYTGTRQALIDEGLATDDMFPELPRRSKDARNDERRRGHWRALDNKNGFFQVFWWLWPKSVSFFCE